MGLSVREVAPVLQELGIARPHGAVWTRTHKLADHQEDPPTEVPSRVAVDEKQIEVDGEKKWQFAAIDIDSKLLPETDVLSRRGTDPAALTRTQFSIAHQRSQISEDGILAPTHREPRDF